MDAEVPRGGHIKVEASVHVGLPHEDAIIILFYLSAVGWPRGRLFV